jgi:hypothetical protein
MEHESDFVGAFAPVRALVDLNALHGIGQLPPEDDPPACPVAPKPPRLPEPGEDDAVLALPEPDEREPEPEKKYHPERPE